MRIIDIMVDMKEKNIKDRLSLACCPCVRLSFSLRVGVHGCTDELCVCVYVCLCADFLQKGIESEKKE